MSSPNILLWTVLPYIAIAAFVLGLVWRFKYDKFNWTTRSSQIYEGKLLRIAGPLFHLGLFAVIGGHIVGLLVPQTFTDKLGLSHQAYHLGAVTMGGGAGVATLLGISLLIYRRRTSAMVFAATTRNDKTMYIFLVATLLAGSSATLSSAGVLGEEHNYRETVGPWARSILTFSPHGEYMMASPLAFRIHAVAAMSLFIIWPFTRLVHSLSAPVGYLFRPSIVYRSRDNQSTSGSREARPGWEKVKY
ncbi:MAG: respiratory nitrate reductase subunit gamma [Actinobacteria bacterium]|jgi:nitrate reductase gamma subunit|nr:respiratory nitrate reductase subunit gamma [Actinomycetota bacterium]NBP91557.1 respiratory nitrate reductase subunit gamma [Actinomycetota bacterium]